MEENISNFIIDCIRIINHDEFQKALNYLLQRLKLLKPDRVYFRIIFSNYFLVKYKTFSIAKKVFFKNTGWFYFERINFTGEK